MSSTVYLVRLENAKGEYQAHRIFSSRELAEKYVTETMRAQGNEFRIIEREAIPQAVAHLKARNQ